MQALADVWLPVLATVGACWVSGLGWTAWCGLRARCGPEHAGWALATGAAWLGLLTLLLTPLGGPGGPWLLLGGLLLPPALAVARRRPLLGGAEARRGWLGFLPCLAAAGLALWLASVRPVWNVDALTRWVLHGQWLAHSGTLTPAFLNDAAWTPTHPRYPPLVPALVGLDLGLGADRDMGVRPLFPFIFLALLGLVYGYARGRPASARAAGWLAAAFALTPCFLFIERALSGGGTGSDAALADVPLALFVTGLSIALLRLLERPSPALACSAAWMAAGAALTKQEGVPVAAATLLIAAAASLRPACAAGRRGLLPPAAALVGAWGLWMALAASLPVMEGESYLSPGSVDAFFQGLERLPVVLGRLLAEFTALGVWGPLWIVPLVVVAALLWRRQGRTPSWPAWLLLAWLAADTAIVVGAYVVSGWRDGEFQVLMNVSFTRLLMHHAPLAALLAAHAFPATSWEPGEPARAIST